MKELDKEQKRQDTKEHIIGFATATLMTLGIIFVNILMFLGVIFTNILIICHIPYLLNLYYTYYLIGTLILVLGSFIEFLLFIIIVKKTI